MQEWLEGKRSPETVSSGGQSILRRGRPRAQGLGEGLINQGGPVVQCIIDEAQNGTSEGL